MRDRLIELTKRAFAKCKGKKCEDCVGYGKGADCIHYVVTDNLLANGVIVPPCKVGHTVYRIVEMSTGVKKNSTYTIKRFIRTVEVTKNNFFDVCENWGKTVFLTAEDAETALKERSENGPN